MSRGAGSIGTDQRVQTGTPFVAGTAFNGLSIDPVFGKIVLGQDIGQAGNPAQLVSNREIPMMGFYYNLLGNLIQEYIDDSIGYWTIADQNFRQFVLVDETQRQYGIGDLSNRYNGMRLDIFDILQQIDLRDASESFWQVKAGAARTTEWNIGKPSQQMAELFLLISAITDVTNPNSTRWNMDGVNKFFEVRNNTTDVGLDVDFLNTIFALGDFTNFIEPVLMLQGRPSGGNPLSEIFTPDSASVGGNYIDLSMFHNPGSRFVLEMFNTNTYQMRFDVDPGVQEAFLLRRLGAPNTRALLLDWLNNTYNIGDMDGRVNGTTLNVNDAAGSIDIANTALNAFVKINGTNGFTGVVAPVTTITVIGGIVTNVA